MPWKDGYTVTDERGIPDGGVQWPDGVECTLRITIALASATDASGISPETLGSAAGYFGTHRGLELILASLHRLKLHATFAIPALFAAARPETVRMVRDAGHEIAALGLAHEDVGSLDREVERTRIRLAVAHLAEATGQGPVGWFSLPRPTDRYATGTISANTVELLIEEGFAYLGNSTADDLPHYWFTDPAEGRALLALPYYYHFDDLFFSLFPSRGSGLENVDSLERNWTAEFAAQRRLRGLTSIVVHTHTAGWPSRLERLERFLRHAAGTSGVWVPTSGELADHWSKAHPVEACDVRPAIWQMHEDSLN